MLPYYFEIEAEIEIEVELLTFYFSLFFLDPESSSG